METYNSRCRLWTTKKKIIYYVYGLSNFPMSLFRCDVLKLLLIVLQVQVTSTRIHPFINDTQILQTSFILSILYIFSMALCIGNFLYFLVKSLHTTLNTPNYTNYLPSRVVSCHLLNANFHRFVVANINKRYFANIYHQNHFQQ